MNTPWHKEKDVENSVWVEICRDLLAKSKVTKIWAGRLLWLVMIPSNDLFWGFSALTASSRCIQVCCASSRWGNDEKIKEKSTHSGHLGKFRINWSWASSWTGFLHLSQGEEGHDISPSQRLNLSNVLHEEDFHFLFIFSQKLRIEEASLIYFEQIIIFLNSNKKTNSNYFVKTFNISSLNSANYTERVISALILKNFPDLKKYFTLVKNSIPGIWLIQ